jgi:tRNA A37 threonylcarbamoyladenosine synthetase subunit TsaC/SUA5/YrdC
MAHIYTIHAQNPQPGLWNKIKAHLESGAVILYPTDTVYAIGCDLRVKSAVQKVRQIKRIGR